MLNYKLLPRRVSGDSGQPSSRLTHRLSCQPTDILCPPPFRLPSSPHPCLPFSLPFVFSLFPSTSQSLLSVCQLHTLPSLTLSTPITSHLGRTRSPSSGGTSLTPPSLSDESARDQSWDRHHMPDNVERVSNVPARHASPKSNLKDSSDRPELSQQNNCPTIFQTFRVIDDRARLFPA